jgi:hypothetical protein
MTLSDNTCPLCGEELTYRYLDWSEDVCGVYCDVCDKSYDYETKEWEDGPIGSEYPWYGTGEWGEDWDEIED